MFWCLFTADDNAESRNSNKKRPVTATPGCFLSLIYSPQPTPATLYHGNKRQMDPLRTHARCCKPPLAITQTHPFLAGATEVKKLPPTPPPSKKKPLHNHQARQKLSCFRNNTHAFRRHVNPIVTSSRCNELDQSYPTLVGQSQAMFTANETALLGSSKQKEN